MTDRTESIRSTLAVLTPEFLEIHDDSHQHAGHNAAAQAGGTHIRLAIVSSQFEGLNRVQRHRKVQELLKAEFESGLHALQIMAKTPRESGSSA